MGNTGRVRLLTLIVASFVGACLFFACLEGSKLSAQQDQAGPSGESIENGAGSVPDNGENQAPEKESISFFSLVLRGGWFMFPLLILSFAVVVISIERAISLRKERMIPTELVTHLGNLGRVQGGFDPRSAYRICQQYPSSAANVIKSLLLKVGRPQSEVETAVNETSQREADRQSSLVSWLSLIATVAPLLGLLGTVWGITQAFFDLTTSAAETNKAVALAKGIYTALVTTLCGLMIAIPSAVIAHFFENRIVKMFNQINELAASLMPQVEKYEGRLRFSDIESEPANNSSSNRRRRPQESETESTTSGS